MSAPGDPGRRLEWVEGPAPQIVAKAVELVATVPGAASFELSYDALRRKLADDEEPDPGEGVVWTASAVMRRRYGKTRTEHTYQGHAIAEAVDKGHADHNTAIVAAVVELLEKLGANVVAMFPTDPAPPTTEETHP